MLAGNDFHGNMKINRSRILLTQASTYIVLSLGLLMTLVLWQAAESALMRNYQNYFDFRVSQLVATLKKRLENYEQVLYGARGLFEASEDVDRNEFRRYVNALQLAERYPGIQGVGLSLLVPGKQKPAHTQEIRQQGFPDYAIYPAGERDVYTSIIYLEPFVGRNLRAFSYDMFSEPVRHKAMVYARDNDLVGMTGKVTLVQETDSDIQAGFLMYLPVFQKNQPQNTVVERQNHIFGWVYSPFRIRDFLAGIGGERGSDLHLSIYDGEQISPATLMFSDHTESAHSYEIIKILPFEIGGHQWTLQIRSDPSLKYWQNTKLPMLVLSSGIFVSVLLTLLTWQFFARGRALALAAAANQELQESEARFRLMADSAPVLIWLIDAKQLAIWFNKRWLAFTGRTLEQELGKGWLDSVDPAHRELVVKLLRWHFQVRKPFNVEYRIKRADGEYRWIIDAGVPRFNELGEFVGFIGSCIDITKHKQMEEELWEQATTDVLTGFSNRRHFLVRLQDEFDRMQRNDELQSSVLMLDLDHFKRINDRFGHAVGDAVLKHFAKIIQTQQRKVDVVGRLGGEEFAIILPDTDLSAARPFAERLRKAVCNTPLAHHATLINVTVSIGMARLSQNSKSAESVLNDADAALYAAKDAGRNQVVSSDDWLAQTEVALHKGF